MKRPKLPEKPVDEFEIKWFSIGRSSSVVEHRALYHINTPWEEVFPDDSGRGVAFQDDWMMFTNGHFGGRNTGWDWPKTSSSWENVFATFDEANAALIVILEERIRDYEHRIIETSAALAKAREAAIPKASGRRRRQLRARLTCR